MSGQPLWQILLAGSQEVEQESQAEAFPYDLNIDGMIIRVREDVYSPRHFYGWRFYLAHLPSVEGQDVLEVGCGAGVATVRFAQQASSVVACDIVAACVAATRENLALNQCVGAAVVESDVFSAITGVFDTIFWNIPWGFLPDDVDAENLSPGTLGNFSVGYRSITRFLTDAPTHLKPGGRILIVAGEKTANWPRLRELFQPYRVEVLARGTPSPNSIEHLRLMALYPRERVLL